MRRRLLAVFTFAAVVAQVATPALADEKYVCTINAVTGFKNESGGWDGTNFRVQEQPIVVIHTGPDDSNLKWQVAQGSKSADCLMKNPNRVECAATRWEVRFSRIDLTILEFSEGDYLSPMSAADLAKSGFKENDSVAVGIGTCTKF
jgi:hypothetical protein